MGTGLKISCFVPRAKYELSYFQIYQNLHGLGNLAEFSSARIAYSSEENEFRISPSCRRSVAVRLPDGPARFWRMAAVGVNGCQLVVRVSATRYSNIWRYFEMVFDQSKKNCDNLASYVGPFMVFSGRVGGCYLYFVLFCFCSHHASSAISAVPNYRR